jgi:hypothetical protein
MAHPKKYAPTIMAIGRPIKGFKRINQTNPKKKSATSKYG